MLRTLRRSLPLCWRSFSSRPVRARGGLPLLLHAGPDPGRRSGRGRHGAVRHAHQRQRQGRDHRPQARLHHQDATPLVAGKKVVTLPKYVPPDPTGQYKFLVFCYVFKGKIDPYRGMAMKPDSDIVTYLKGVQEIKDKKPGERLKFFFNYLDNADPEISMDAFKEFANADYKDYRGMAAGAAGGQAGRLAARPQHARLPRRPVRLAAGPLRQGEGRQAAAVAGGRPRAQAEQRRGRRVWPAT